VIVTITLNAALRVAYTAGDLDPDGIRAVSRPAYRAAGRGVTVARLLRAFGHDVLAAGLAGGAAGELIREDLAQSGVPTAFTLIRGESRRIFRFAGQEPEPVRQFGEPGPYITTEELGRFAADYRRLMTGAAAVVLCGSLPDGLPPEIYGSLVTYAAEAGVPVILDAGGEELKHAVGHRPDLVVAETSSADPGLGAALIRLGAGAAAVTTGQVASGQVIRAVTATGQWTARIAPGALGPDPALHPASGPGPAPPPASGPAPPPASGAAAPGPAHEPARGALVAGLVPGQLLGWSWPDRLRNALALAAAAQGPAGPDGAAVPEGQGTRYLVDLAAYERLLDAVTVESGPLR
jgi:tagatose 6-phosphate kinase